jgi:hypothetical protein
MGFEGTLRDAITQQTLDDGVDISLQPYEVLWLLREQVAEPVIHAVYD